VEGVQKFEWDDANTLHLARHSVSPKEAEQAILDPDAMMLEVESEGEERWKAAGSTLAGRILVVVFTFRDEAVRPITAYNATVREEKIYLEGRM
jgi:uncharacterized DUF497 family protein